MVGDSDFDVGWCRRVFLFHRALAADVKDGAYADCRGNDG